MSAEADDQFSEIRGALGSIGLSSIVVFAGSILSQAMGLGTRVVMTRFLPVDGYGDVVLGITVLNALGIVSIVGLGQAQVRYLPRAKTQEERTRIAASIYQIGIVLSLVWAAVGFFGAEFIAGTVFDSPGMANVVRVFALTLPFYVLYKLSLKGIQGNKLTTPTAVTRNLVHPLIRIAAVASLALAGFGAIGLAIGYNLAFMVGGVVGFGFFLRYGQFPVLSVFTLSPVERYQGLLSFSIPLAISGSFGVIATNADRFLLGVFVNSTAAGKYDVALLLAQFVLFFGPVLGYLTGPIFSELESEDEYEKLNKLYTITARWLVVLTFPIFSIVLLAPELLLGTVFGEQYRTAGFAVLILISSQFLTRPVGLSDRVLMAKGETKIIMYITFTMAGLNIGLNIILIPIYGIVGAAITTAVAGLLKNFVQVVYIYYSSGIHPFSKKFIYSTIIAVSVLSGTKVLFSSTQVSLLQLFVIVGILFCFYPICLLITRSIYTIELKLADSFLKQLGIQLNLENRLSVFTEK